ncbi:MAG: hypothetical protein ACYTXY_50785, partial [Nostoc sp.]
SSSISSSLRRQASPNPTIPGTLRVPDLSPYFERSDADGHLQVLRQLIPNTDFVVIFDLPEKDSECSQL